MTTDYKGMAVNGTIELPYCLFNLLEENQPEPEIIPVPSVSKIAKGITLGMLIVVVTILIMAL